MSETRGRPCKFFLKGHCPYGDNCKFTHQTVPVQGQDPSKNKKPEIAPAVVPLPRSDERASTSRPGVEADRASASSQTRSRPKRGEIPCRAWREGECAKGAKCWFAHDPQVQEAERLRRQIAARAAERMEAIRAERVEREAEVERQRVAQLARAAEQEAARRAHEEAERLRRANAARDAERLEAMRAAQAEREAEVERQRVARLARAAEQEAARRTRQIQLEARKAEIRREEATKIIQRIVLGSSLVTFSAGISVQEVVAGFQTCRIQIKNLPGDAQQHEIKALFTQQGVDPTRLFISGTKELPDGHLEATLITTSEEGGAIAAGLEDIEFRQERLHFEVAENAVFGGMGNSARESDTLTLSWRAPSNSVVATFQTVDEAEAKVRVLNRQKCGGRQVRVEMNQPPPGLQRPPGWQRAIKITGLPMIVSPETVTHFTGSQQLKFLRPISYDIDSGLRFLKQAVEITAGNGLKHWDVVARDDIEGNMTVKARFESWEVAKQVHDSLAGKRLSYLGNCSLRLRLPDPLQYILSIPLQQYQAQKRTWDSLAEGVSSKTAYIRIFSVPGRMQIKVLGEDKKAVGSMKVRVETLAGGEQLPATCWHRSFRSAGGTQFLASIFGRTGAYARADWKLCIVKVYGDSNAIASARDGIKAEVDRLDSLEWSVFLKKQSVRFFVQRGIPILKERLGEDNAALIFAPRAKVVIKGGEEARHILTKLIDESLEETAGYAGRTPADVLCPICYDEVSHPVTLGCDHTYCNGCLRHYLSTADNFPLVCLGNEATCETPIPLPTIENFLPTPQFHQLLETAFLRYIERHPQELKYCKTPDCSQVYRSSTNANGMPIICPSCFLSVCSSCDEEAHEGMSCADRRLHKDPGEQERRNEEWARANGANRCPSCSVWIQKTEGCNHMTCRCGAHICWVCMRVFEGAQIYPHLHSAHGGPFDNVPPEEPALVVHNAWVDAYEIQQQAARNEAHARRQLQLQEYQARVMLEERQRRERQRVIDAARYRELARQEEIAREARREQARREEGGWGCIVM
ncbi:hypothetical protein DFH07DRAFT_857019 [Mycena maculata]|uniref:RING-type E3 ubiquitin transferase n=1 Tax=Mycena maculata TaxID=230809 RepID=A0AAD7MLK8_9AGAR|nr:hypothetical protein DFH07DRAFT_857019 [Mycena maculata]